MLFAFLQVSNAIEYNLAATELIISGTGTIDKEGVKSKGSILQIAKVTINNGPSKIDDDAFYGCYNLESVTIPESVQFMGHPFTTCEKLSKIVVSASNSYFCNDDNFILYTKDKKLLMRAPTKANINIPEGVVKIQSYAFSANTFNFGDVIFPSSVTELLEDVFYASVFNLISFKSGSQLSSLHGMKYIIINKLSIPSSVKVIKKDTFYWASIKCITFDEVSKLETIEENAFDGAAISEILLPDSLKTISQYAFKESKLSTIGIGSGCSNISLNAFAGCKNLTQISVSSNNNFYKTPNGVLMDTSEDSIIFVPPSTETLKIPGTVKYIGQTMLQSSKLLKTVSLDGESSIWDTNDGVLYSKNFQNIIAVCGGVSKVSAHSNVKSVNDYAAYGCTNLNEFSFLGSTVAEIGEYSFSFSGLVTFDLPNTVTTIGKNAFQSMANLTTFNMNIDSPIKNIPKSCFAYSSSLKSFSFGKSVNIIYSGAFLQCLSLSQITFPDNSQIQSIYEYVFESTAIINLEIPATVVTLATRCFKFCKQLITVVFKEDSSLTTIQKDSFKECINLQSVVLPNSCTKLETEAFSGCTNLSKIIHNLEIIESSAFKDCIGLKSFHFSARQNKATLNPGIFLNCYNIFSFTVDPLNNDIKDISGCVYSKNDEILYLFPPGQEVAKILPNTLEFADNAFAWSPKLMYVAFYSDSKLTTIGRSSFYECKHLINVHLPSRLITIKEKCFYGCTSLQSIVLPGTLTTLEECSFIGCNSLKSVKYCGTKEINNGNVFESHVVICVTDLYPIGTFCTNEIRRNLLFDCELKPEFLPTCKTFSIGFSLRFVALSIMMFGC